MRNLLCVALHRTRGKWMPNVDGYWFCLGCHADRYL